MIDGSTAKESQPPKRRKPKDPTPRLKEDRTRQLDAISGCPEAQVPEGHLARNVSRLVAAQSRTLACVLVGLLEDGTWAVMGAYPSQG